MGAPTSNDLAAMQAEMDALRAQLSAMAASAPSTKALDLLAERSAPRDNPNYNEVSPFTYPEGEKVRPKPSLIRDSYFAGARQREDALTPGEIDLFNRFDTGIRTSRNGTWKAEVRQNGSSQELHIDVPVRTPDDRMSLPPLALILRELLEGQKAADPTRMAERLAELEKKLAAVA